MNREQCKALLPVMQAFAEGKDVDFRFNDQGAWRPASTPSWCEEFQYRIKPEPRVIWVNEYEDGSFGPAGLRKAEVEQARFGFGGRTIRCVEQPE